MTTQAKLIATFILVTSALVFGGVAAYLFMEQRNLEQNGIETTAIIVEMIRTRDSEGDDTYTPVFEFRTRNGRGYQVKSGFSSSPPEYTVGDRVTIIYLPDSPEKAEIKGAGNLIMYIFGGVAIMDFAILVFFLLRPSTSTAEKPSGSTDYQSIEHF